MMTTLFYLSAFVIVLSLVVIVHEGGHFLVARLCGVKVTEFSLGFGKKLFSRTDKKGTDWQIRLIPLGGYVKMLGDEDAASAKSSDKGVPPEDKDKTFICKTLPQRMAIIFAGPAMNYIFAFVLLIGLFWGMGEVIIKPVIGYVSEGSAAQEAGLQVEDEILSIDDKTINSFLDIQRFVSLSEPGKELAFKIKRNDEEVIVRLTPRVDEKTNRQMIGVLSSGVTAVVNEDLSFTQAVLKSAQSVYDVTTDTLIYLGQVLTVKRSPKDMRGPLGIAEASGDAMKGGIISLIAFIANISIAIGLMNLLPIPLLDGGHLFFYLIEGIRGKALSEKIQVLIMWCGFALLIAMLLYTMFLDIPRIVQRVIE